MRGYSGRGLGDTLQPTASLLAFGVPEPPGAPPSCGKSLGEQLTSMHRHPGGQLPSEPGVLVHHGAEPLLEPIKCKAAERVHLDAAQVIFLIKRKALIKPVIILSQLSSVHLGVNACRGGLWSREQALGSGAHLPVSWGAPSLGPGSVCTRPHACLQRSWCVREPCFTPRTSSLNSFNGIPCGGPCRRGLEREQKETLVTGHVPTQGSGCFHEAYT